MYHRWLPLLLFLFQSGRTEHIEPPFPDSLYPRENSRLEFRSQCPSESYKFEFCSLKYEDCFGQLNRRDDCNHGFCKCVKKQQDYEDPEETPYVDACRNHSDNACYIVHQRGAIYAETILRKLNAPVVEKIKGRLENVVADLDSMAKSCHISPKLDKTAESLKTNLGSDNELLNFIPKLLALPDVESSMLKNLKVCRAAMKRLEDTLKEVDDTSAKNLKLPYEFSHIGSEFGPLLKVAMRVMSDEACEKATLDFNHKAVIWVNCYDQQKPKNECDSKYIEGIYRTLSTMDSKKAACSMVVDVIKTILPIRSNQFYNEAANYHVESSQMRLGGKLERGFSGFLNGSVTGRDTKNTILRLDASEKTSLRVVDSYEKALLECGSTRRSAGVVSYCGYLYGYCTLEVQSLCQIQFSICLSNIDHMDPSIPCQSALNKTASVLWTTERKIPPATTEISVQSVHSQKPNTFWQTVLDLSWKLVIFFMIVALVLFAAFHLTGFVCRKYPKLKKSVGRGSNPSVSVTFSHSDITESQPILNNIVPSLVAEKGVEDDPPPNEDSHEIPEIRTATGNNHNHDQEDSKSIKSNRSVDERDFPILSAQSE